MSLEEARGSGPGPDDEEARWMDRGDDKTSRPERKSHRDGEEVDERRQSERRRHPRQGKQHRP